MRQGSTRAVFLSALLVGSLAGSTRAQVIRGRITDAVTNERVASADNVDDIPISDIHGIEVYSGPATVPVEYRNSLPNGFCGLVMIWTRHGSADIVRRRDN